MSTQQHTEPQQHRPHRTKYVNAYDRTTQATGFESLSTTPNDTFLNYVVRCSLIELLDHTLLLQLRDGTVYIGVMCSYDQYSNIILNNVVQRKIIDNIYIDITIGVLIIRGENIVLLGTYNSKNQNSLLKQVSQDEFTAAEQEHKLKLQRIAEAKQNVGIEYRDEFET